MILQPRYGVRAAVAVLVLVAAWWFLWPDSDLTSEFRSWSAAEPKSEGYRSVGPSAAELTVDRSGSDTYRLRLSGQVVPAAACEAVWYFLKADNEDPAPVVIEVVGSSGEVSKRKESGATC
ncbi:hypothetical protein FKR81_05580 [Lentzea tibetensis]|uniref:Uncharacterized protein n=1 Tax=Lentzea tibetensis TaxID=2591470 RepID=A0A563F0C0_9PSEU|nr:hypothetical protein [Lentzea tibetensis]TWP53427.1 hypothetical protein FKR81_05580 [Lentzea tibetensis]